uniref:Thyroglobulin type-1 domain-containing protein n=1 Tax=Caenorhabditis tropicalis TaxID=1561998 RepID=A0A1I7UVA0_9PELO
MSRDVHLKRGQRKRCKAHQNCKQWCLDLNQFDAIPRCYQRRCWCATPDSPMVRGYQFYQTTTQEPVIEEASGMNEPENPSKKPVEAPGLFDSLLSIFQ